MAYGIVRFSTPRPRAPWRAAGLVALVAALCWHAASALAQSPPMHELQAELNELEVASELPPEAKARAVEYYRQAIDDTRIADDWQTKAAGFRESREQAPRDLEAAKVELNRSANDVGPAIPERASLDELRQGLAAAEAESSSARAEKAALEAKLRRRVDRFEEVRVLDAAAKARLEDAERLLALSPRDAANAVERAERRAVCARRSKTIAERAAYAEELPCYEATRDLLRVQLDLATRRLNQAEQAERQWKDAVAERGQAEAELKARDARWAVETAPAEVRPLAESNEQLARLRKAADGPAALLKQVEDEASRLHAQRARLQTNFAHVQKIADLADAAGPLLQRERDELPDVRRHREQIHDRKATIAAVKLKLIDLENERSELADLAAETERRLAAIDPPPTGDRRQRIDLALREQLEMRRDCLDALIADYDKYFNALVLELDKVERELVRTAEEYGAYISEQILWIRSAGPVSRDDWPAARQALAWLTEPAPWRRLFVAVWDDVRWVPLLYVVATLIAAIWWALLDRTRGRLRAIGKAACHEHVCIGPTIEALGDTLVLASFWPACLAFVAWRLGGVAEGGPLAKIVAFALHTLAVVGWTSEFFRQICCRHGLAEAHFCWPAELVAPVRRHLRWLMILATPLVLLVAALQEQDSATHQASLGRWAFIFGMTMLAVFARNVLRPNRVALRSLVGEQPGRVLHGLRNIWYPLSMGLPLALAGIAAAGYYYTALQLAWRLQASVWLVLGALVLHSFLGRWLEAARCGLSVPACDLDTSDRQSRRLMRGVLVIGLAVGCWLTWIDVLPALRVLDKWRLWAHAATVVPVVAGDSVLPGSAPTIDDGWVTAADLMRAVMIGLMTIIASGNVPGLLEIAWLRRLPLDAGGRYAWTTVSRYLITLVGLVTTCRTLGIGWSSVQWLAAAMTVGLGFGLQEIFANFVSGLIILFERPVRVGDTVTIGGLTGTVSRIRSRATTIIDWDRKELIVPNKEFITSNLVNWTLSDHVQRLVLRVGVAYGSDTALVERLLLEVARQNPQVLDDPPPQVLLTEFADSALQFELRVFVSGIDPYLWLRHPLNAAINEAFREAGLEIAFPQRDIHVRTIMPAALPQPIEMSSHAKHVTRHEQRASA